jgi:hypothetical protein
MDPNPPRQDRADKSPANGSPGARGRTGLPAQGSAKRQAATGQVVRQASKSPGGRQPRSQQTLAEPVLMIDVEAALEEITRIPAATIHRAAAFTWASRAIAGYRICAGKNAIQEGLSYLYLGEHYREAALAHAAMGEAWQPLFAEIDEAMAKDRQRAFASMRGRSPVATR